MPSEFKSNQNQLKALSILSDDFEDDNKLKIKVKKGDQVPAWRKKLQKIHSSFAYELCYVSILFLSIILCGFRSIILIKTQNVEPDLSTLWDIAYYFLTLLFLMDLVIAGLVYQRTLFR